MGLWPLQQCRVRQHRLLHLYARPAALDADLASQAPALPSYGGLLSGRMGLLGTYLGMWRLRSVVFGELGRLENARDVGETARREKGYSRRKLSFAAKRPQCTRSTPLPLTALSGRQPRHRP